MSSSFWLDDIILPKKGKAHDLKSHDLKQAADYTTYTQPDTVILNESDQKNYLVDCNDNTSLQLQVETSEGPRVIPISGQHIITTADGQQFLAGGVITEEQPGFIHTIEGGQTFVLSTEQGGQQIYQDNTGQQYIICDIPGAGPPAANNATATTTTSTTDDTFTTNIDSFISKADEKVEATDKQLVKLPNGPDGEYITYEVQCQVEEGSNHGNSDKSTLLDQEKLANLLNALQTGEHGQALSNADLFILVPPEQENGTTQNERQENGPATQSSKDTPQGYVPDTGDIITDMGANKQPTPDNTTTKYVAVKMKKSDLTVNYNKDKECVIKNTHKKANRKITEYADSGFVKSKAVEEVKEDWEYSVWSGAAAQPAQPPPALPLKRKRGPTKKDKSESKQAKLDQLTLDIGQKIEPTVCSQCGMMYNTHVADDEQNHNKYHKRFLKASSFSGWKTERVVEEYHDGRIILVNQHDPKSHIKKMDEIREIVDIDLGITDRNTSAPNPNLQAFLYISNANKVIASAFVEHIEKGYLCISSHEVDGGGKLPVLKSGDNPMKAVCGISRIWVFKQCRRKKIASRLMDCVRANFVFGCTISKVKIAFSDPTENGRLFAQTYCGTPNFLIYR